MCKEKSFLQNNNLLPGQIPYFFKTFFTVSKQTVEKDDLASAIWMIEVVEAMNSVNSE